MKKIFSLLLIFILVFSLVACNNTNTQDNNGANTSSTTENTEAFETVPDKGKVEYEKEYTMKEILEIKTNWNAEYAFPCDVDKVTITKETDTEIKMSLETNNITLKEAVSFYDKYTANKDNKTKTTTAETCLFSFEEDYIARTIMIAEIKDKIVITIEYSMDDVNKR